MAYEEGYEFVEVPVNVRTFVGEVSEVIHSYELSDGDWYPVGGSWAEVGLLTHDGGPEWVIKNITSDSYMWEGRDAAISAGEFDIYLRVVAAKTSPLIGALASSGSLNSPDSLSLTHPLSQKWWLIFHEETFRSGAKRRRVFYARAFVVEQKMERNQVLAHEITFRLLPIASVVGDAEEIVAGGLDVAELDSNGKLVSAVPPIKDTKPGSGMPGSSSSVTLPPAGSTSGSVAPISAVVEPMGDKPMSLSDLRKKESVMFEYKWAPFTIKEDSDNVLKYNDTLGTGAAFNVDNRQSGERYSIDSEWIQYAPFEVDSSLVGINFKYIKINARRYGETDLTFGIYEASSGGKGNLPGRLLTSFGNHRINEEEDNFKPYSFRIPSGGWRFPKKGLYFTAIKVVNFGSTGGGFRLSHSISGNTAFAAQTTKADLAIFTDKWESEIVQNSFNSLFTLPSEATPIIQRRINKAGRPSIFLSTDELEGE